MERKYTEWDISEQTPPLFRETVGALIQMLIKPDTLKRDLFFSLLLTLMKENDFQLQKETDNKYINNIVGYIISKRKLNTNMYDTVLFLKGYENMPLRLVACPMADVVLINCTIPEMCRETYSLCLPTNRYVMSTCLGIPTHFANIDELCLVFKNSIITPIRSVILNRNSTPSGALTGLPADVLHLILLGLPVRDILSISESCKRINDVVNEDCLWARLYSRDFADKHKTEGNWLDMYKKLYITKQRERVKLLQRNQNCDEYVELSDYMRYVPGSRWEIIL